MRIVTALLIILSSPLVSLSQDLSGTWEEHGGMGGYAKICIIRFKDTYIGYTYDEKIGFCKANFLGEFNVRKKKLKGVNKGFIKRTSLHFESRYNLNYVITGGREYLKGTASPKAIGVKIMSFGIPMLLTYTRTSHYTDTTAFMLKWMADNPVGSEEYIAEDTPDSQPENTPGKITLQPEGADSSILSQKTERKNDTVSVITTRENELKLTILDNGIGDGDTISIIHNDKVLVSKEKVSVKGTTLTIQVSPTDPYHEIILVADNVGSIPPNTALVIIDTGKEKYRLIASTDLTKNAMIIFRYRE